MASRGEFTRAAQRTAEIFLRRHAARGRCVCWARCGPTASRGSAQWSRGSSKTSSGSAGFRTKKFEDLLSDPRFTLHTATTDPHVGDGDAKVWEPWKTSTTRNCSSYAEALYAETGFDLRGRTFEHFFRAGLVGAAAVEVGDGHMDVTMWRDGGQERMMRKH